VGRAPRGVVGHLGGGAQVVDMRDIFILNEIEAQDKIYFGRHFAWLKYEAWSIL
jgi:hypothetical protein